MNNGRSTSLLQNATDTRRALCLSPSDSNCELSFLRYLLHRSPSLIEQVRVLFDKHQQRCLGGVLLGLLSAALLEMAAIGAVPAFVVLLNDPNRILEALPQGAFSGWIEHTSVTELTLYSTCFLAMLFIIKNVYIAGVIYIEGKFVRDFTITISNRLFHAYLCSPYTFHLQRNPAHLIRNISLETTEAAKLIRSVLAIVRESLVLVVVFLLLLMMDPLVSVSVFALVGTTASIFYIAVRRSLSRRGKLAQTHRGRQVQVINQGLGSIKDAKILGREPFLLDLFRVETEGKERHELFLRLVQSTPRLVLEVAGVAALVVVAAVFVLLDRSPQTMLPVLALLAVSVVRLVPSFNVITQSLTNIRYTRAPFDIIYDELKGLEQPTTSPQRAAPSGEPKVRNAIRLQDVQYRYPDAPKEAVRGITLTIPVGKAVAFIGASGAGKSTIVDLILGLLSPTSGEIRIDGQDIHRDLPSWQRQIGYVPQDIYLTDDTIRRNIAFGIPDDLIDDTAIVRAVHAAQLDAFVGGLPQGLGTTIGNRGVRLSGGQRQRIGIARALYHQPAILVMDEATSALDNETERAVIESIARMRGNHTIIMIAHRLTTVMTCDRLYLIEKGQVKDEGSYPELAQRHEHLRPFVGAHGKISA